MGDNHQHNLADAMFSSKTSDFAMNSGHPVPVSNFMNAQCTCIELFFFCVYLNYQLTYHLRHRLL